MELFKKILKICGTVLLILGSVCCISIFVFCCVFACSGSPVASAEAFGDSVGRSSAQPLANGLGGNTNSSVRAPINSIDMRVYSGSDVNKFGAGTELYEFNVKLSNNNQYKISITYFYDTSPDTSDNYISVHLYNFRISIVHLSGSIYLMERQSAYVDASTLLGAFVMSIEPSWTPLHVVGYSSLILNTSLYSSSAVIDPQFYVLFNDQASAQQSLLYTSSFVLSSSSALNMSINYVSSSAPQYGLSSYSTGWNDGYTQGQNEGYNSGYSEGYYAGASSVSPNEITFGWLVRSVDSVLSYPIFGGANAGFTLGSLLVVGLCLSVFGGLLKLFFGG